MDSKRRLSDKNAYLSSTINPTRVLKAAKVLVDLPLYQGLGIKFNNKWNFDDFSTDFTAQFLEEHGEVNTYHARKTIDEKDSDDDDKNPKGQKYLPDSEEIKKH